MYQKNRKIFIIHIQLINFYMIKMLIGNDSNFKGKGERKLLLFTFGVYFKIYFKEFSKRKL